LDLRSAETVEGALVDQNIGGGGACDPVPPCSYTPEEESFYM